MDRLSKLIFTLSFGVFFCATTEATQGLYVSVLRDPVVIEDRSEIDALIEQAVREGYDELYVQVYRANQAWFPTSRAQVKPGEIPYLIRRAHERHIQVHAWLNLLSLSANADAPILKRYGISVLTRNAAPKNTVNDYKVDGQFFLEPGDERVVSTLEGVLTDLLRACPDLDGVQLDYIRYPDVKPAYGHNRNNLARYRASGGKSTAENDPLWRRWKRDQVTTLVRRLKTVVRTIKPTMHFSTTGLMTYTRAREESFQDWKVWVESGLTDFVSLMCYTRDEELYQRYLSDARRRLPELQRVNIVVAGYKLMDRPGDFKSQWDACQAAGPRSCAAIDYGSIPSR